MENYECIFICSPQTEEDEINQLKERIEKIISQEGEGKIISFDYWGKKNLSYPIKKFSEGLYYFFVFQSLPSTIKKLKDFFQMKPSVIRQMIVKKESKSEGSR